jgi:uncharacterized protein (DUF2236 family)
MAEASTPYVLVRAVPRLREFTPAPACRRTAAPPHRRSRPGGSGRGAGCGEVASAADIARRGRLPFSAADLDAFVGEQRASAELIGIDRAAAPASMAELDAYYEQIRPGLYAAVCRGAVREMSTARKYFCG